jgi:hypothetical protein
LKYPVEVNQPFKLIFDDHFRSQGVSLTGIRQEIGGKQIDLEDEGCWLARNVSEYFPDNTA